MKRFRPLFRRTLIASFVVSVALAVLIFLIVQVFYRPFSGASGDGLGRHGGDSRRAGGSEKPRELTDPITIRSKGEPAHEGPLETSPRRSRPDPDARAVEIAMTLAQTARAGADAYFRAFARLSAAEREVHLTRGFMIPHAVVASEEGPEAFFRFGKYADEKSVGGHLGSAFAGAPINRRIQWFEASEQIPSGARAEYRARFVKSWVRANPTDALTYLADAVDWDAPESRPLATVVLAELKQWKDEELVEKWTAFLGE